MRGDTSKGKKRREGEGPNVRRAQKLVPVRSRPIPVNRIVIFKRQTQKKFKISTCLGTAASSARCFLKLPAARIPIFYFHSGIANFEFKDEPMIVKVNV